MDAELNGLRALSTPFSSFRLQVQIQIFFKVLTQKSFCTVVCLSVVTRQRAALIFVRMTQLHLRYSIVLLLPSSSAKSLERLHCI